MSEFNNIRIGDTVRLKPLKWFEENCRKLGHKVYRYEFYDFNGNIYTVSITPDILKYCDKDVTISDILVEDEIYLVRRYKIFEDLTNSIKFSSDFFVIDNITNIISKSTILNSVNSYCNDFCVLGDRSKCSNLECPLYRYNRCKL